MKNFLCGICLLSLLARDRKSTRLNSSHLVISYAVCCLKKTPTQQIYYLPFDLGHNDAIERLGAVVGKCRVVHLVEQVGGSEGVGRRDNIGVGAQMSFQVAGLQIELDDGRNWLRWENRAVNPIGCQAVSMGAVVEHRCAREGWRIGGGGVAIKQRH